MLLFIALILIAILFRKVVTLDNRVSMLEFDLARLRPAPEPPPPAKAPFVAPAAPPPATYTVPAPEHLLAADFEPAPKSEPAPIAAASSGNLEELIGGNLLNKLGALVLVIGIALFLSYSFTNMGPLGRIATGAGLSGALLATGVFIETKEHYKTAARGVLASGWAGLYFTSYAAYAMPAAKVIDNPVAGTVLMIAVALGMVLHSLRYKVQSLTALAFGCVFAALALSDMNTFVAIALVPLAASMLYLARRFDWHELALLAAAATYGVFLTRPDTGAPLASIQAMLLVFWVMFEAFDQLRLRSRGPQSSLRHMLFAINGLAGLGASGAVWFNKAPDSMWIFCAGASALYLASTWLRYALDGETLYEFSLGISAILGGLAIFARVEGIWTSIALMLEAELLFLAGWRLRIPVAKVLSWLGFAVALHGILDHFFTAPALIAGFKIQAITPPMLLLAALLYLNRGLSKESYWSYAASVLVALTAAHQTNPQTLISVTLLTLSAILFATGRRMQLPEFRYQSYAAALASVFTAPWADIQKHPQADVAIAFATIAIAGYAVTARLLRAKDNPEFELARTLSCIIASLAAFVTIWMLLPGAYVPLACAALALLVIEAGLAQSAADVIWTGRAISLLAIVQLFLDSPVDQFARVAIASAIAAAHYLIRFRLRGEPISQGHALLATAIVTGTIFNEVSGGMLTLAWSLEGIALLAAGFLLRDRWLRLPGLSLLLLCIAKVFVYDLSSLETMYRILSFIGLGLILLGVSFIYTRFKEQLQKLL